jgi:glycosyltransferase involved in cell wall biosynthesis
MIRRTKDDYRIGAPNVRWFAEVEQALQEVARHRPLVIHLITAIEYAQFVQRFWRRQTSRVASRLLHEVRIYQWSEEMVSVIATACDLAVIPLPLNRPLERGKPESKLVSFWRMGLPTVTAATPAYVRTMGQAQQNLACRSDSEWIDALIGLIENDELRARAGQEGRTFAEERYSDERQLEAWAQVFESI